jgi:hypothetical protein
VGRPPAGSRGLTDDLRARARAWADRSSLDQDLLTKVTDRASLLAVAVILGASSPGTRRRAAPSGEDAQPSDPPNGA